MDRFQILKKQDKSKAKPVAYQFTRTSNAFKVYEYIKRCITDEVAFNASNIYPSVIDQALSYFYQEYQIPIITRTESMMRGLLLTHNDLRVYDYKNIPERFTRVICYWDLNSKLIPKKYEIALVIIKK